MWENLSPLQVFRGSTSAVSTFVDSYMVQVEDLPIGSLRLLEVDTRFFIPAFRTVRVDVTSADVLHSWAVPSLGIKLDACPGRLNSLWFLPERIGVFYGQCSELCGMNHGFMPICVESFFLLY